MDLQTFIIRRLVPLPLVLLGVAMLVFTISYLMPGDPVALALGPRATPEDRAKYRAQLGLDQPAPLQFARYLGGLLQGDFGISLVTQRPVAYDLRLAIPASLELSLFAITISVAGNSHAVYSQRDASTAGKARNNGARVLSDTSTPRSISAETTRRALRSLVFSRAATSPRGSSPR